MSALLDRVVARLEPGVPEEILLDPLGRVQEVADHGRRWRYRYDANGDLLAAEDSALGLTEYRYDDARRLTLVSRPDGRTTSYRYDGGDRLAGVEDAGHQMSATHDALGRLVALRYDDELLSTYCYDGAGRVAEAHCGGVTTRHVHGQDDRVVRVEQVVDGVSVAVDLGHDAAGRLSYVAAPGGPRIDYAWEAHRLARLSVDGRVVVGVEFDDDKRTVLTRLGNGVEEWTRADPVDGRTVERRITRDGIVLLRRCYAHDGAGRIAADGRRRYDYDGSGRLAHVVETDGPAWSYGYDAAGNLCRASRTPRGATAADATRPAMAFGGERLLGLDGEAIAPTHDARGALTGLVDRGVSWAFRYDAAGRLVQVRRGGRVAARMRYDHKGRLVLAQWSPAPGASAAAPVVERYVYGPGDELLAVADAGGTVLRLPLRSPWALHGEALAGPGGARVRYEHADDRGTLWLATGEDGEVLAEYDYDAFGAPLRDATPAAAPPPTFGGRRLVPGTGCYWFGARWYAPRLRRFLTPDTWTAGPDDERLVHPALPGRAQAPARTELLAEWARRPGLRAAYAFCGNDPVNRIDPTGHWSFGSVVLSLLGALWALPMTVIGLVLEVLCLAGEVVRWLAWIVSGGHLTWQPPGGFDVAASSRLSAFGLVFSGGWMAALATGMTFGNIIFVDRDWESLPAYSRPGDILPRAYQGRVRMPRKQALYEHELTHTKQYARWGPFFLLGLPLFGAYEWDWLLHGFSYADMVFENDARDHSEGPDAPTPVVATSTAGLGGVATSLSQQWVYWRASGNIQVLRAGPDGVLHGPSVPGSTKPWEFTAPFEANPGDNVEVASSAGACPLPPAILATPGLLIATAVLARPDGRAGVNVPVRPTTLAAPGELALWPLARDLPDDGYLRTGLPQGAALWTTPAGGNDGLNVAENTPAPDPGPARPAARALRVRGDVEAAATAVRVFLLDGADQPVPLTPDPAGAARTEAAGALGAPAGARRPFTAELELLSPAAAFGQVYLAVVADTPTGPTAEAFTVYLCGLQAALIDDPAPAQPGAVPGEADEVVVVDFDASPRDTPALLADQARARRMVRYRIANAPRPLVAGGAPVLRPRMPLWMGELQLVGVARAALEDLLRRRADRRAVPPGAPAGPSTTRISFRWSLRLEWDGPDSASAAFAAPYPRPNQRHAYTLTLPAAPAPVTATLSYDPLGRLTGPSGQPAPTDPSGELPGALQPAPQPAAFPLPGRRLPVVRVGALRRWGRAPADPVLPSLVVEFQPSVQNAAGEVIRGGDGTLSVDGVTLDGNAIDAGAPAAGAAPPPAGAPLLQLPVFRAYGQNPPAPQVEDVVRALVTDYVSRHAADAHIAPLTSACWAETVLRILRLESGGQYRQFDDRGAGRRRFQRQSGTWWFGTENGMPLFGPPHGYGIGQLDLFGTPQAGATDEQVWNWVENLRAAVGIVLAEKAPAAWALISAHVPSPLDQFTRAVFQREVVRRYNGGHEFTWTGTTWAIAPPWTWLDPANQALGPNPNITYPNLVLGTGVVYFTNAAGAANQPDGASTQFMYPPPVAFQAADYGPGTGP